MIPFFIFIIILYVALIGSFSYGFRKLPVFELGDIKPSTKFSVVIPFRNEANNLEVLLNSILDLNYSHSFFEILLINDNSSDNSVALITQFIERNPSLQMFLHENIRTTNAPKKDAITLGIQSATHEWIITTDADCKLPTFWLDAFDAYIQLNEADFIAGPIAYYKTNSFLKSFQQLDFISLIGATVGSFGIGKPFLCNGANLAYKKALFHSVNGFKGNTDISSGDDIFLLEKAIQFDNEKVHYLKSKQALVLTKPMENFQDLISQRIRWASKTTAYSNGFGKLVGFLVLLSNASLLAAFTFSILGLFNYKILLDMVLIKFSIDFLLIFRTSVFFDQGYVLKWYPISAILYPFFSVYTAIISMFSSYKWKGRRFKK
jgi:glycosyltransferase involved in cell wall biosynthesis